MAAERTPADLIAETLNAAYSQLLDGDSDVDLGEEAGKLEERLWRKHHGEYIEWLRSRGRYEIRHQISHLVRDRRRKARSAIGGRFEELTDRLEKGELTAEQVVDSWRINIGEGIERKLMDATGRDLDYQIDWHRKIARSAALEQAFYQYLRDRTPDDRSVGSVMSARDVVRVRREVCGGVPELAAVA